MKVLELSGDHYQMGWQHAQQVRDLRPQIVKAMRQRLKSLAVHETDLQPAITELTCVWQEVAQPTLAMLRGIAEGLDLKWASFLRYTLASYLESRFQPMAFGDGCTVWAATGLITLGGDPVLVKNRDYRPNHPRLSCLARARPAQGYSYLCATSAGSPAVFSSGMNEVGLAVADTHVTSLDVGPGVARYSAMMEILEHHNSVASALDYLQQVPHIGDGTLILADAIGELAVFETGNTTCAILRAEHDFVVSTNHFRSIELCNRCQDLSRSELRGNSQNRYARVAAALETAHGRVDVAWAQALMADHGGRKSNTLARRQNAICRHSRVDPPYVTISIAVYAPQARTLFFGNDRPCRAVLQAWPVI